MADKLNAHEIAQFTAAFSIIDLDGGGSIELRELLTCAADFGYDISLDELRSVVALVDSDGSGSIEIDEFLEIMGLMLYRHKLESSDDDDDDDDAATAAGGGGAGGANIDAILGSDGSVSSAASPDEKARAQQVMKMRSGWAAEAVQQLHGSLEAVQQAADAVQVALEGGGAGDGDANIAAFQIRKQQEQAQAQLNIARAATARLAKRILVEAKGRGITTAQLPQIESLELDDAGAEGAGAGGSDDHGDEDDDDQQSQSQQHQSQKQSSGGDDEEGGGGGSSSIDPEALLRALTALATQLKRAADALGANLVPMSMVKSQHTRGGGRLLGAAAKRSGGAAAAAAAVSPAAAAGCHHRRQHNALLLQPGETYGAKPTVNKSVLAAKISALDHFDVASASEGAGGAGGLKGADEKRISDKTMALVSGVAGFSSAGASPGQSPSTADVGSPTSPGGSSGGAGAPARTSDALRAVAQQVLRSWAFPITPVCEQLDLLDDRWREFLSLLQGFESLTRPACPLGRACPDRYNHAHRMQLTHPCYCRIDRFAGDTPLAASPGGGKDGGPGQHEQKKDDPLQPLSEASLCPHMVRPVHGNCYTHLQPRPEEVQRIGGGGGAPGSPTSAQSASKAARLNELQAIVGRVDLTNIELGGVGAQAVAFVIAQDCAATDNSDRSGDAARYASTADASAAASNQYKFKDVILDKCCVPPPGAIAMFRVAHNLRMLDISHNMLGQKTVVIGEEAPSPGASPSRAATASGKTATTGSAAGAASTGDKADEPASPAAAAAKSTAALLQQQQREEAAAAAAAAAAPAVPSLMGVHIRELLYRNGNLTHLALAGNRLTDSDGIGIAEGLRQNVVLRVLDLSHNELGPRFGRDLALAMADNMDLRCLRLAYNPLENAGTTALLEELKQSSIVEELDLTWTGLGPQGAQLLGDMVSDCQALLRLSIAHNAIALNGAIALAKALPNTRSLVHLDMSFNPLPDLGIVEVLNGLRTNTSLHTLDVSETTAGGTQTIMKEIALVTAERLQQLPPDTPQTNVICSIDGGGGMGALPAHLVAPDEPIKLQSLKPPAPSKGSKGAPGKKKAATAASSSGTTKTSARK